MSAFCSTRSMLLVNENISTSRKPSITARPSADVKRQFVELATRLRVSESALMLIAIRSLLESQRISAPAETGTPPPEREPSTDRITIRLRPGDMSALNKRAKQRGIRPSGYIASYLRAHLYADPPLTIPELTILKEGVSVLSKLRRALAHTHDSRHCADRRHDARAAKGTRPHPQCCRRAGATNPRLHPVSPKPELISWIQNVLQWLREPSTT